MNLQLVVKHTRKPQRRVAAPLASQPGPRCWTVLALVLCVLSGCGDETKFRPKVGGGLKRDTGDEPETTPPPANPSSPGAPPATPGSTPSSGTARDGTPSATVPTAAPATPSTTSSPASATETTPRRTPVARVTRSRGGTNSPPSQMQLECNGKLLIRPLVIKPLLRVPGRKAVWLLTSSTNEDRPSPLSVCLRFETDGDDPANLVGRPWKGQLFVQNSSSRQLLGTPPEGEVHLEFTAWDEDGAEGRILPGELQALAGEKPVPYEGTFVAETEIASQQSGDAE
jgi:hypothetical protein